MKLTIRKLEQKDLKVINTWWDKWPEWERPPKDFLPETGLVVESNGKLVTAGFLYLTNSKVALLEWFISDPNYRDEDRQQAIDLIVIGAEQMLKTMDFKYVFSITAHKKMIASMQKLGWDKDEKPSHEMVKIIK